MVTAVVLDDARVDDSHLKVQALRELDAPHLRALERVRRAEDSAPPADDEDGQPERRRVLDEATDDLPAPLRSALVRCGTVVQNKGFFGSADLIDGLTPFGRTLLEDLRMATDESRGSNR